MKNMSLAITVITVLASNRSEAVPRWQQFYKNMFCGSTSGSIAITQGVGTLACLALARKATPVVRFTLSGATCLGLYLPHALLGTTKLNNIHRRLKRADFDVELVRTITDLMKQTGDESKISGFTLDSLTLHRACESELRGIQPQLKVLKDYRGELLEKCQGHEQVYRKLVTKATVIRIPSQEAAESDN